MTRGTWRWGRKQRRGGLVGRVFDAVWRWTIQWSLSVEGTVTWYCSDDMHQRERKLDYEMRVPRVLWRPYCWWRGGHNWHDRSCVFCEAPFQESSPDA